MIKAIVYLCLFGPSILGVICFAIPQATWVAADKNRAYWGISLIFPISGFFMTIPFLLGPLPALMNPGNKPTARASNPTSRPGGGTIFSDD